MRCPKCGNLDDKVIDSRLFKDGSSIRRRRECLKCEHRFTTYEDLEREREDVRVIKRDGRSEALSQEKLLGGIRKACEKRPISLGQQEKVVEEIIQDLESNHGREIPSRVVGLLVMQKLRDLDQVAYVRYASIYRNFTDVGEFISEIQSLEKQPRVGSAQAELFKEPIEISHAPARPEIDGVAGINGKGRKQRRRSRERKGEEPGLSGMEEPAAVALGKGAA